MSETFTITFQNEDAIYTTTYRPTKNESISLRCCRFQGWLKDSALQGVGFNAGLAITEGEGME